MPCAVSNYFTDGLPKESNVLEFYVNGKKVTEANPEPEITLLTYLRTKLFLTGSKLGCGEGGCGACTVMISKWDHINSKIIHYSANACLAPVVLMHGCAVTTVEGIGSTKTKLHAVQERLAKFHGSQCGFCTPGIVMSMYALLRNKSVPSAEDIEGCLQGNLCRCTGYRPILSAFNTFTNPRAGCPMGKNCCKNKTSVNGIHNGLSNGVEGDEVVNGKGVSTEICFSKYDPSQEIIFPPQLLIKAKSQQLEALKFTGERVTWFRPSSLEQLVELKEKYPNAQLVNGNTEIGVETGVKGRVYPVMISPSAVDELKRIEICEKGVSVGSSCTLSELRESFDTLRKSRPTEETQCVATVIEMLHWFAGDQIRNVAAIGGNIMTASPISDLNPILMANESLATFRLHSRADDRRVLMDQSFFPKYRTTCAEKGEVLLSVFLPFNGKDEYMKAYKQSKRREDDIAIVNAAMRVVFHPGTCKVLKFVAALGGMAATSVMPKKTMQNMIGRLWTNELMEDFVEWIREDLPLGLDAPGGMVEYREALAASLFFKFFLYVKNCLVEKGVMNDKLTEEELSALQENIHVGEQLTGKQTWQEVDVEQPPLDKVGKPLKHVAGELHATGEAVYVDDIPQCSSELYLCLVTSTRPHAFIRHVDVSAATAAPGFVTYVDHRDVSGSNNVSIYNELEEVFATKKVTCIGQVIGAVVADTQAHAQRAAQLVRVEYEDISPVIITIEEAVSQKSFHGPIRKVVKGNAEEAMTSCDHVIEGEVRTAGQEHFYMETQVCLAVPKDGKEMEIYSSNQDPSAMQITSSVVLGVDQNSIVIRVKRLGGGFGGKATRFLLLSNPVIVAAAKCGRPVRCMLTRQEDMAITGTRHPFLAKYKVGCTKEGRLVSLVLDLFNNGGNTMDSSLFVMTKAMINSDNCYSIPNMLVQGAVCRTNVVSNTAFRGFGAPQAMFIIESWITKVAEELKMSPEKVREMNLYRAGDLTHFNHVLETSNGRRCWEDCMKKSQYDQRRIEVDSYNSKNRWRKRGIACVPTKFAIGIQEHRCQAGALVHIYTDGSVYLTHGGTEMGQGLHTKMIQIAGRCLGIPASRIHISETSTASVPNGGTTAGSLGSDLNGMAVKAACDEIAARLVPVRKKFPELSWDELIGQAYRERVSLSATGFYRIPNMYSDWDVETGIVVGRKSNYYTYGAAVSEVEVDCLTGDHVVLRTDIVMDVGKSLNPAIDIGQIEGGFVQGYGLFTMEEPLHTPSGRLLTVGPGAYKIPGFGDCPKEFNVHLLGNSENDKAIYSSKAVGEPPLFLAASAFFAIKDAVGSARKDSGLLGSFRMDAPATAERIRLLCGDRFVDQHRNHATAKEDESKTPWAIRT